MSGIYLLAVDLGTSFIKAAIYDTDGTCHGIEKAPVNSDSSMPGIFLQHGDEIFDSVLSCIKKVTTVFGEKSKQIAAIGFTGQMAGFMGVDESWNDITTWSCSLDTRYLPYAGKQMEELEKEFLEIGGTNSPLMAPKCEWFETEFPKEAKTVKKYMLISSYVVGRLGKCRIEDAALAASYITWTGLADIKKKEWSEELCERAGISTASLPEIADAVKICGRLDETYAAELNLPAGIPLVAGAGDKIAGCVGTGIVNEGDVIFETSSYAAVSCLQKEYRPNNERRDYDAIPACTDGLFYLHRYLPGSGITLKWFMDNFGESFEGMEAAMSGISCGSEGLFAVGLFGGNAMPLDGSIRGAWVGQTWSHKKEHFYHALLESFAYEVKATLDSISSKYPEWNRYTPIHVIGGGTGSQIWMQMLSDVTGSRILCHTDDDEALWGASVIAGCGVGVFESLEGAGRKNGSIIREIIPNEDVHKKYIEYANIYEELKKNLAPSYKDLQNLK